MATTMTLPAEPHVALVRCQVRYLGRAAPANVPDGLEAIQKPLHELYASVGLPGTFDSILTVYTSGVVLDGPTLGSAGDQWLPFQSLLECGAFRAVNGAAAFLPLTSPETRQLGGSGPPLFAMTFKRRDIPTADCWAFVAKSDQAAVALYTAMKMAHGSPAGWSSSPSDRPPSNSAFRQNAAQQQVSGGSAMFQADSGTFRSGYAEWDGAIVRKGLIDNRFLKDYYEKPPLRGYFYTPSSSLVQKYCVSTLQHGASSTQPQQLPSAQPSQQQQQPIQPPLQQQLVTAAPPRGHIVDQVQPFDTLQYGLQPEFAGPFGHEFSRPEFEMMSSYADDPRWMQMPSNPADGLPPHEMIIPSAAGPLYYSRQPIQETAFDSQTTGYTMQYPGLQPAKTQPQVDEKKKKKKKKHHKKRHESDSSSDDEDADVIKTVNGSQYVVVPKKAVQVSCECDRPPLRDVSQPYLVPGGAAPWPVDPRGPMPPAGMPMSARDDYINPVNSHYESRIVPGPMMMQQGPDPFADEGPYERRLPIGGGAMLMPGGLPPAGMGMMDDPGAMMYGSNFILRPNDGLRRAV